MSHTITTFLRFPYGWLLLTIPYLTAISLISAPSLHTIPAIGVLNTKKEPHGSISPFYRINSLPVWFFLPYRIMHQRLWAAGFLTAPHRHSVSSACTCSLPATCAVDRRPCSLCLTESYSSSLTASFTRLI